MALFLQRAAGRCEAAENPAYIPCEQSAERISSKRDRLPSVIGAHIRLMPDVNERPLLSGRQSGTAENHPSPLNTEAKDFLFLFIQRKEEL